MTAQAEMLSVSDALSRVINGFRLIESEYISLSNAHGRVLADDVQARLTQPPVAMSSMDGYAVKTEDVLSSPTILNEVGVSRAGSGFDGTLGPGECVRIFTGAPIPDGASAIVIQEITTRHADQIEINEGVIDTRCIF